MAVVSEEDRKWAEGIERGEQHVPALTPELTTTATAAARTAYVRAWDEWRYKPNFGNAAMRDDARRAFYGEVGRAALGPGAVDDR